MSFCLCNVLLGTRSLWKKVHKFESNVSNFEQKIFQISSLYFVNKNINYSDQYALVSRNFEQNKQIAQWNYIKYSPIVLLMLFFVLEQYFTKMLLSMAII